MRKKKIKKNISCLSLSVCVCMCIYFLSSFLIYDSFFLSLSLGVCVYICVSISFFSDLRFFLFWSMILSSFLIYDSVFWSMILSLSLSLSLSVCVYVCVSISALLMLSVEVSGIAENGPFFGLKPNRSGFYFLIFLVWLPRKWGRRVLSSLKPSRKWGNWRFAQYRKKRKKEKRKRKKEFLVLTPFI